MCIVDSANPHEYNQTLIAVTFYLCADDILAPYFGVLFLLGQCLIQARPTRRSTRQSILLTFKA